MEKMGSTVGSAADEATKVLADTTKMVRSNIQQASHRYTGVVRSNIQQASYRYKGWSFLTSSRSHIYRGVCFISH